LIARGGLFVGPMLRVGKLLSALRLALAFSAAIVYCLIGSAGRGADAAFAKKAKARQVNEDREYATRDLAKAKARYQTAMDVETFECSGGAGPKCIAKRQITKDRRHDLDIAEEASSN
jgi:hypothetical protein